MCGTSDLLGGLDEAPCSQILASLPESDCKLVLELWTVIGCRMDGAVHLAQIGHQPKPKSSFVPPHRYFSCSGEGSESLSTGVVGAGLLKFGEVPIGVAAAELLFVVNCTFCNPSMMPGAKFLTAFVAITPCISTCRSAQAVIVAWSVAEKRT